MRLSSSCKARSTGWRTSAKGIADNGDRDCGAAAGVPADRPGFCVEAEPDAAGDAMARAGTPDLLRAVSNVVDPDPGESRSDKSPRRRRWRRAVAVGTADVA